MFHIVTGDKTKGLKRNEPAKIGRPNRLFGEWENAVGKRRESAFVSAKQPLSISHVLGGGDFDIGQVSFN